MNAQELKDEILELVGGDVQQAKDVLEDGYTLQLQFPEADQEAVEEAYALL